LLHEFSKASEIYRPVGTFTLGTERLFATSPAPHRLDESQPVIPWRVALLHCPPPLRQLSSECYTAIMPVERFTPNDGTVACSNVRCQARTAAHVGLDFSDLLIEAGLGSGAQEATHCDPPTQNDARRARGAYYSERTIRCPHDSWRSRCHTRGHRQPRRGKFAFLFVAPVLNAVPGLLAGAAYFLCIVLDIRHGFTFSHGLIDYIVLFPKSHKHCGSG